MNAPLRRLAVVAFVLFATLFASTTWTQFVDAGRLNADGRNTRTLLEELGRDRGPIVVAGEAVATSTEVDDVYNYQREYAQGPLYAHSTGFYSVFFGASGIEQALSDVLAGTADQLFYRRVADIITGKKPQGATVELTLDPAVQQAAADALGGQRGAVVAMNPQTGEILALVSSPSYDPNALATHDREAATATREALLADPARPLENRAIASRLYPPGSVFKLVTAAAAIESGRFDENSVIPGPAELDLPQTTVNLPNSGGGQCGSGEVSLTDALRISCNTAFGFLGLELGGDALREQAQAFGFGEDLRIPLGVTPSTVPEELNPPQSAQSAIGQYDVRVSPLQIAMVSSAIANGGVLVQPNLVRAIRDADLQVIDESSPVELGRPVSGETAAQLARMMITVVQDGTGTAAQIDGVTVAGKSGTAQHAEGRPPHAWFTSFAPAEDPQVAVAVVVEEGGEAGSEASGGRTAAPIARAVMEAVLNR
ncbi:MAG TPA: penicillin-binding protein 2 [Actinomycetales bacterium]|nr:penicillin-binding protein 2 [Actinomycetales bacterium]